MIYANKIKVVSDHGIFCCKCGTKKEYFFVQVYYGNTANFYFRYKVLFWKAFDKLYYFDTIDIIGLYNLKE